MKASHCAVWMSCLLLLAACGGGSSSSSNRSNNDDPNAENRTLTEETLPSPNSSSLPSPAMDLSALKPPGYQD